MTSQVLSARSDKTRKTIYYIPVRLGVVRIAAYDIQHRVSDIEHVFATTHAAMY